MMSRAASRARGGVLGTMWNEPVREHPNPKITPFGQRYFAGLVPLTADASWNARTISEDGLQYDPFCVFLADYEENQRHSDRFVPVELPRNGTNIGGRVEQLLKACGRSPGVQQIGGVTFDLDPERSAGWPGRPVPEPEWAEITMPVTLFLEDGRSLTLDGVNTERGEAQVILYTPAFGETTETNRYGAEAVVADGRVVEVSTKNEGSTEIPRNGFVLSAHEAFGPDSTGYRFIARLVPGQEVSLKDASGRDIVRKPSPDLEDHEFHLALDRRMKRLSALHALDMESPVGAEIGEYRFEYADGAIEQRPIIAGQDLVSFGSPRFTFPRRPGVWVAFAGGRKPSRGVAVYGLDWENPHPKKQVAGVTFRLYPAGYASGFLLLGMSVGE